MAELIPVSPSEMLQEESLKPLGLTGYRLTKDIGVPLTGIYDIVAGMRAVTAETDLLLCRYFGLSDGWWLSLQSQHDTHVARKCWVLTRTLRGVPGDQNSPLRVMNFDVLAEPIT